MVDEHGESYYDGSHEYGYTVYDLVCGHETSTQHAVIGRSPGAPYAGRPVAASHHPRDLSKIMNLPEETE